MSSQGTDITVSAICQLPPNCPLSGVTPAVMSFTSLLATPLCHCKFTVGFKAFRGLHSNEKSFSAPLCLSIAGHPCIPGWEVWCTFLL